MFNVKTLICSTEELRSMKKEIQSFRRVQSFEPLRTKIPAYIFYRFVLSYPELMYELDEQRSAILYNATKDLFEYFSKVPVMMLDWWARNMHESPCEGAMRRRIKRYTTYKYFFNQSC